MNKGKQKGVTLIALIITIIVMIILVAVTVRTAVNSGLFGHAKDATEKWADRQREESEIGNDNYITDSVNEYTGNKKYDRTGLKIGDYVDYTPDTAENYMGFTEATTGSTKNSEEGIPQENFNWRILSINEDGSVDIVSDRPTTIKVYLKGSLGFNNGVLLLNKLCETQYSNSELKASARSINLLDIENKLNEIGINAKESYISSDSKLPYGENKTYNGSYAYTPDIYMHVGKNLEEETKSYYTIVTTNTYSPEKDKATQSDTLDVKQTYYYFSFPFENYFNNTLFYEMLFKNAQYYWIASRSAFHSYDCAMFSIRYVYNGSLGGDRLIQSDGWEREDNSYVRPVVHLGANINISLEEDGSIDHPRTLSK